MNYFRVACRVALTNFSYCVSQQYSILSLAISVTCMAKKWPMMFKKTNSENLLWLVNGEPMPAGKTLYNINCKKRSKRTKNVRNRNWTKPRPRHHACKYTVRNWEPCFTIHTPRLLTNKVKYDESKFCKFLILDTETNTTICWAL